MLVPLRLVCPAVWGLAGVALPMLVMLQYFLLQGLVYEVFASAAVLCPIAVALLTL